MKVYLQWEMLIWVMMAIAIVLIFIQHKLWPLPLTVGLSAAYALGLLETIAIAIVFAGLFLAFLAKRYPGRKSVFLHIMIILWAVALAVHLFPGFNNLMVLNQVHSGPQSQPFSLYFNLDKPMLIFAFLILVPQMLNKPVSLTTRPTIILATFGLLSIPWLAWWAGLIKPELSMPDWIILFAFNNLFMTCVAEEVFFRGYLHHVLERFGSATSLIISSLLFALVHAPAGWLFASLAGIAGLCYGLVYLATGRLYWAVAAHFLINLYHLVFFTYPFAKV